VVFYFLGTILCGVGEAGESKGLKRKNGNGTNFKSPQEPKEPIFFHSSFIIWHSSFHDGGAIVCDNFYYRSHAFDKYYYHKH
jgi:hypothetical protein